MSVQVHAVYLGELRCKATHGPSGSVLVTEAPLDNGGTGQSFSPTDLVATALGTCLLTILGLVSKRHDLDLSGTTVRIEKEMAQAPIRRIRRLSAIIQYPPGIQLEASMRSRIESAVRTCPVHQSLHPEIESPIEFVGG